MKYKMADLDLCLFDTVPEIPKDPNAPPVPEIVPPEPDRPVIPIPPEIIPHVPEDPIVPGKVPEVPPGRVPEDPVKDPEDCPPEASEL